MLPLSHEDPPPWRESVLDLVLHVGSYGVPVGVVIGLATLSSQGKPVDIVLLFLALVACVVVALRFVPQLGFAVRAGATVLAFQMLGLVVVASVGPMPGATLGFATAAVLGAVLFGTRVMVALLVFDALSYVVVGVLVHDGWLSLRAADTDMLLLRNWIRSGSTTAFMAGILAAIVAHVVGQLEAGAGVLRTMYRELSVLHRRLDAAKEQGDRMISRELEAEVAQALAALKLRMKLWQGRSDRIAAEELRDAVSLVDDLIARTRTLSVGLRPPLLDDLGIEPALRALVEARARQAGIDANMEASGLGERLPADLETACYRIVEAAVEHAIRDPRGRHLVATLRRTGEELRIRVENEVDERVSVEVPAASDEDGMGLAGARERVRMLGGEFELSSRGSRGQQARCIDVTLPIGQSARLVADS